MPKIKQFCADLFESRFRLVPACRVARLREALDGMQFVVDGTEANARVATQRYMEMGHVLKTVLEDYEKHPGTSDRRMKQTARLRDAITRVLERRTR